MAELKTAENWPVRDASPCPRCRPWCRRARTRPTAAIDLPDQPTRGHLFTGVVADVCRRGGRRGGRGGLSPPLPRVDPGAAMLRATRPGDDRRNDLSSCSGAQAGWPLRGRAQASYAAAGQPQGSSGGHSSGGLRGSPKPRPMMVITIVGHVATVSPGVKINGSASICTRPGAQWSCRNRHQGEGPPERAHTGPGSTKPRYIACLLTLYLLTRRRGANAAHTQMRRPTH